MKSSITIAIIIIISFLLTPVIIIPQQSDLEGHARVTEHYDEQTEPFESDTMQHKTPIEPITRSGQLSGGYVWIDDFDNFENSESWKNISITNGALSLAEDEVLMLSDNFSGSKISDELWNVVEGDGTVLISSGTLVALKQGWPQTSQTYMESRESWQVPRRMAFQWNSIQESGLNGYDHEIDVYYGPSAEERIWISIKGDKHVRLQSGTNSKVEGPPFFLSENRWYSMNCKLTQHTASLIISDDAGRIVNYQNLTHTFTSTGGIRFLFADVNTVPGYFDVRADNVTLHAGFKLSGELKSNAVTLEEGYKFDRLSLNKVESVKSLQIRIDVVDAVTDNVIEGFSGLTSNALDLSTINHSIHRSIALRATLSGDSLRTPELQWWAVTINQIDSWYDDYIDNSKIAQAENLIITSSKIILKPGVPEGYLITLPISVPQKYYWNTLAISKEEPSGNSYLSISILDSTTGQPIGDYYRRFEERIFLNSIDPAEYPSIQIKAEFHRYSSKDPILFAMSLNWSGNHEPKLINLQGPAEIYRGESETYFVFVSDPDEASDTMELTLYYRKSSSGISDESNSIDTWENSYFGEPAFINGRWELAFSPTREASIGSYDFKVVIKDSLMSEAVAELKDLVEIIGQPPPAPEVIISPAEPRAGYDLRCFVTLPSGYVKSDYIFEYRWYRNSKLVNDLVSNVVPSDNTAKYDLWKCEVVLSDGYEKGQPGYAEAFIENSPPEAKADEIVFTLTEDPSEDFDLSFNEYFFDEDNDALSYTMLPADFLEYTYASSNDGISIKPQPNWFGTTVLMVYASDDSSDVFKSFIVKVLAANDAPVISAVGDQILTHQSDSDIKLNALEGEELIFRITAFDLDGDELTYSTNRTDGSGNDDLDFMKLDEKTGLINFGTPSKGFKEFAINIRVFDSNGSTDSANVIIVIQSRSNQPFEQFLLSANWLAIIIALIIACFVFYGVTIGRTKLKKYMRKRYQKQLKGTGRYYANYPMVTKVSGELEAGKYPGETQDFNAFVNPYRVAMYSHNQQELSKFTATIPAQADGGAENQAVQPQITSVSESAVPVQEKVAENQIIPMALPALPPASDEQIEQNANNDKITDEENKKTD